MAAALKDFFDAARVRSIGARYERIAGFPLRRFVAEASRGLDDLELLDRARHIARALRKALPEDDGAAIEAVIAALGPPLPRTEGNGMAPFAYLPDVMLVAEHGMAHVELSLRALYELTRRFTSEWGIRPFLARHPDATWAKLQTWARDPDMHVRRLVSEGTRPRLPWTPRVPSLLADPRRGLALLERLKDDPEEYVRRSVANHLNDVAKDAPELVLETCERWAEKAPPDRMRLIRHALRSLVKRGDARALSLVGAAEVHEIEVVRTTITPKRPAIGDRVAVSITLRNAGATAHVVVDLVVHFVKARGDASPKVFKGRALDVAAGEEVTVAKTISLAQHTTRTHYAGRHLVEVVVNGQRIKAGAFVVCE
jgi:3-methyladenine DNA glycosylase AlkC